MVSFKLKMKNIFIIVIFNIKIIYFIIEIFENDFLFWSKINKKFV